MSSKSLAEEAKSVLEANTRLDEAVSGLRKRVPHADRLRGEYSPLLGEEEELVPLGAGERPNWQDRNFCRRHGLRVCGSDSAEDRLPLWHRILEVVVVVVVIALLVGIFFYIDYMHFYLALLFGHMGSGEAQHIVAQRLLAGKGAAQDHQRAMEWFKSAADKGHPHAAYNLALGLLKGLRTDLLQNGELRSHLEHAVKHGVPGAEDVLKLHCAEANCEPHQQQQPHPTQTH